MCDRVAVMGSGRLVQFGTPFEIYERPRDPFIADFVGRTNKLAGRVSDAGRVAVGPLTLLAAETPPKGRAVTVMIRPHRIEIRPKRSGRAETRGNVAAGRVVRTIYVGDLFQYEVDIGPGVVQVEKPTAAGPQPFNQGDEVELEWAAGDTLVFEQGR